ncbi:MAG: hypothetical protein HYR88_18625 [Verrucomicrobia bacterium]|nr:hypothetical protein [Verrucomicrobiota bacterium]MBI3870786.1 hypothetical protein [Verrucomicrobiota bacterium]
MPIRLNLLREHQEAEEARRRDPVKRAVLGGVVIVICMLGWAMVLQFKAIRSNAEYSGIQGHAQAIEKMHKQVLENKRLAAEAEDHLIALQRLTTNRFLWGNALQGLQHLLADTEGISITRVRGEQVFSQQAESKAKSPKEGVARPATATERIVITVDARDASTQPGDQVAKLKASLATPLVPKGAPAITNQVALLNISAPQTDKEGSGASFVTFTLQSTYAERVRQ